MELGEGGDDEEDEEDNMDEDDEDAFAVSFWRRQVVSCIGAKGLTTKEKDAAEQSTSSRHQPRHSYRDTLRIV